jgi:hypothetical protein
LNSLTNRFYDFISNWRTRTMKTLSASLKALVVASLACAAGFAAAADTQTLAVTASVTGMCRFSAASTPLAFGAIDPSLATDKTVTANVLYKCTKGTTSAGVTATGGLTRTMTGVVPANTLAYALAFTGDTQVGLGFGTGNDRTLVVTGTITAAQYNNVAADTYSESVTLNITP